MSRSRIDALLVARGLFESRERARAAILAGDVRVEGATVRKASELVAENASVDITARERFVSRGGDKLDGALAIFGVATEGRRAIDVGASTGGFTDRLLRGNAASVVALDVGYGQLAWSLRTDDRVTVIERTNVRKVDPAALGAPFDIVVCDVSFISLKTVLPHLEELLGEDGDLVALVKPQFEAGKGRVGKRGVVREAAIHEDVLREVIEAVRERGLVVSGLTFSPITGPEGNIEFWVWVTRRGVATAETPETVVAAAHAQLGGR